MYYRCFSPLPRPLDICIYTYVHIYIHIYVYLYILYIYLLYVYIYRPLLIGFCLLLSSTHLHTPARFKGLLDYFKAKKSPKEVTDRFFCVGVSLFVHTATRCNTYCNILRHTLQHAATCCNMLQPSGIKKSRIACAVSA